MSTAELSAHKLYENYNLASLTQEVKHCLITLLGGTPIISEQSTSEKSLPKYTVEELRDRAHQGVQEYVAGECRPISELNEELERDFPWAFK